MKYTGLRVLVTGASGAFGAPLIEILQQRGAARVHPLSFGKDWDYANYARIEALLPEVDLVVLAHGAKKDQAMEANCTSFVEMIERARKEGARRGKPLEVWAVGSEIECHPAWGNADLQIYKDSKMAYARHAWGYFWSRDLVYRHIVPAAFTSRMGPGLISGKTAVRIALFWIDLGARYVPVTYTGIAFLNYFKFLLAGLKRGFKRA